ncbi:hypothetical protein MLD38_003270 [Melastoma candidum]|uniref:Uncharacterized protein n=1 Tax=Melastoma candidum TaxID=119954 RepID=A0ACB9S198_9MYRT|nr:hypothetical protein MLD38_003270 [Melastoma candidum]
MTPKWRSVVVCVLMLSFFICIIRARFDASLKGRVCNGELYPRHQASGETEHLYECAVNHVVKLMPRYTPSIRDRQFYYAMRCKDWNSESHVYGRSSCKDELSPDDCAGCLRHALDDLFSVCTHSTGAQVQLEDCRVRYEKYVFND